MKLSLTLLIPLCCLTPVLVSQEQSVKPGINKNFQNPDVGEWVGKFETEGREVYDGRETIVKALGLKPGMVVADIGAGTGLFTKLMAPAVGPDGKVYAVDIAKEFVQHVELSSHAKGLKQVTGVVCGEDSVNLPEATIDLAYICDTYHHFEFPLKTMRSLHQALKPGGTVVLVDFERIEGTSSEWIMGHVRAGKEVFRAEIEECGFEFVEELDLFNENYVLKFRKK